MTERHPCWVDGVESALIPIDDRGFLFGDHVFETMLWDGLGVPLWSWHWARLCKGAEELGLVVPSESTIRDEIQTRIIGSPRVLRLTLTRGSSDSGYWPTEDAPCRRVLQQRALPASRDQHLDFGISAHTSPIVLPPQGPWAGLKHGNRITQVMLARQAQEARVNEALVYRSSGELVEGISSNVLISLEGHLFTPQAPEVAGVGLAWLKSKGVAIQAQTLTKSDVVKATEVIFINAVMGPRNAIQLDGRPLAMGPQGERLRLLWRETLL